MVENGGVVSSMGTRQTALLAKSIGCPFYVAVESHKFVRKFPLGPEDLGLEGNVLDFRTATEGGHAQESSPSAAIEESPMLDLTYPELLTAIITHSGIRTPNAVSEELIKIWN